MQTYRVETKIEETGRLSLSHLPFRAGEQVEVVVRLRSTEGRGFEMPGQPPRDHGASDTPPESDRELVIAEREAQSVVHLFSPRLAHPEDASDFKKEIVEIPGNAQV